MFRPFLRAITIITIITAVLGTHIHPTSEHRQQVLPYQVEVGLIEAGAGGARNGQGGRWQCSYESHSIKMP